MENKTINHRINMLYRQLGKSVFESDELFAHLSREQKKLMKSIEKAINSVEKSENIELPENACILAPEQNEQGLYVFKFCKHCHVGNHPESTHCSHCNEAL